MIEPKKRGRPTKYKNTEEQKIADAKRKRSQRHNKRQEIDFVFKHFDLDPNTKISPAARLKYGVSEKIVTLRDLLKLEAVKKKLRRQIIQDLVETGRVKAVPTTGAGMKGAPRGKGIPESGGYGSKEIDKFIGVREGQEATLGPKDGDPGYFPGGDRRRVSPGVSPDDD